MRPRTPQHRTRSAEIFRVETIEVGREDLLDAQARAFAASVSFQLDAPGAGLSPLLQRLP
jgi:hypothetical protein